MADNSGSKPDSRRIGLNCKPPPAERLLLSRFLPVILVVILLLTAFGFRYETGRNRPWPPEKDAFQYDLLAQNLAAGRGFVDETGQPTAFRLPLYPLFLAGLYSVFGRSHNIIILAEALLGTGMVFLLYWICLQRFGFRQAILSSLLAGFYPSLTFFYFGPGSVLSETLFLFLLTAVFYFFLNYVQDSKIRWIVCSGLLLSLGILTRGTAVLLPLFFGVWIVWMNRDRQFPIRLRHGAVFLLLAWLPLLPWIVRNRLVFDVPVGLSTSSGVGFYRGNNLEADGLSLSFPSHLDPDELNGMTEARQAQYLARKGWEELWQRPGRIPRLLARKLLMLWDPFYTPVWGQPTRWNGIYLWALPFFFVGLARCLWKNQKEQFSFSLLSVILVLYFNLMTLVFYGDIRSRAQFEPALLFYFGPGWFTVVQFRGWWGKGAAAVWSGAVLLLALLP